MGCMANLLFDLMVLTLEAIGFPPAKDRVPKIIFGNSSTGVISGVEDVTIPWLNAISAVQSSQGHSFIYRTSIPLAIHLYYVQKASVPAFEKPIVLPSMIGKPSHLKILATIYCHSLRIVGAGSRREDKSPPASFSFAISACNSASKSCTFTFSPGPMMLTDTLN